MRRPAELADGTRVDYGLGTRLGSFLGHRVLGHTGSGGGFTAVLEDFPDDRLTIAVSINTEEAGANAVAADIARTALEVPEAPLFYLPPARELGHRGDSIRTGELSYRNTGRPFSPPTVGRSAPSHAWP